MSVGGGSGGHVTPVVAVIKELQQRDDSIEVRFVCDRKFAPQARELFAEIDVPVSVVVSGKLRRYSNLKLRDHMRHFVKTYLRNIWDFLKVIVGFWQSFFKLIFWRPNVVFAKGGYVCLPVGLAAHILRIPLVIHDSDSHPGLTNRILARYAAQIGTGAPTEFYPSYPKSRTKYIGVPIRADFKRLKPVEIRDAKKQFDFDPERPLVVATGGGLGAEAINDAMTAIAPQLIEKSQAMLITGRTKYDKAVAGASKLDDFKIVPFVSQDMTKLLGAADVVVSRASATTIAELAAVHAAVILVPSPYLANAHQMKNAQIYSDAGAVITLDEREFGDDAPQLLAAIERILNDNKFRESLCDNLSKFARPNALNDMADMIQEAAQ